MASQRPMRMTDAEKKRIVALRESGLSPREISEEVNRSYVTVLNLLKRKGLAGRKPSVIPQPTDPLGAIQAIIDRMNDLKQESTELQSILSQIAKLASKF